MLLSIHQVRLVGRRSRSALLPVCFLLVFFLVSFSRAQQTFIRTYGGPDDEEGRMVQQTSDGGYTVSGWTRSFGAGDYDYYLVKTNASGDTEWTRTYGGPTDDRGGYAEQTADGGYILSGFSLPPGDSFGDIYLVKTNDHGDVQWTKRYAGANDHWGYAAFQTSDLGYIVSGSSYTPGNPSHVYLIKTDSLGDSLWARTYGAPDSVAAGWAHQDADGGYHVIGGISGWSDTTLYDVLQIKTDSSGVPLWAKTYGAPTHGEFGFWGQPTSDGGYIISGTTDPFRTASDVYIIKTNASGDTEWTRTYGGPGDDWGIGIRLTLDGGYIVTGFTSSFGAGGMDVWLLKLNASGDTLWTRTFGGTGNDFGWVVDRTTDGGYVVGGTTYSFGAGAGDIYLIKTDANGNVGIQEPGRSSLSVHRSAFRITPNPFTSFARIPGHEAERFDLYDISGKCVGVCRGDRFGERLAPGVYFLRVQASNAAPIRIVKVR
jgi:hypothetical protein